MNLITLRVERHVISSPPPLLGEIRLLLFCAISQKDSMGNGFLWVFVALTVITRQSG